MHRNRALVPIFLSCLLAGCPKRIDFGARGEIRDARELLEQTSAAEAQVVSLKGESKLKVDTPRGRGSATLFVAVARPALLHLEMLDFFGRPQGIAVSDGQQFGFFSVQEGTYYQGAATPSNLGRFLPLAIPPDELVRLMLGQPQRILPERVDLAVDSRALAYVLTLYGGSVRQTLLIDPRLYRVMQSHVDGMRVYDVAFDDFDTSDKVAFPKRLSLKAPGAKAYLELRYTDVVVDESPDHSLFEVKAPTGAKVVDLDVPEPDRADAGTP